MILDRLLRAFMVYALATVANLILAWAFMLGGHFFGLLNMNSQAPGWWIWGLPIWCFGVPVILASIAWRLS